MATALLIGQVTAIAMALLAALTDWRRGEIPNWLVLPPIVLAPVAYGVAVDPTWAVYSVAGIFLCGLVPFLMHRRRAIGGGDVKLFAAIGGLTGISMGIEIELVAFVVASLYSLGRLAWAGKLLRTLGNAFFLGVNPLLPRKWRRDVTPELMTTVRMGGAIFAATLISAVSRHPELWS